MAASDAAVPVTAGFRWNGTTSDLAQQLYRRSKNGGALSKQTYSRLPDVIEKRLKEVGMTFDELPGLLQRAVLWDAGYVENGNKPDELVRVQTLNGVSMAEIAVSREAYLNDANCSTQKCTQPDGSPWYKNQKCDAAPMLSVARCRVDAFESGDDPHLAMWSTGGVDSAIPAPRLLKHTWRDGDTSNEVAAIHTAETEPDYAYCSTKQDTVTPGVGSLIIPCELSGNISERAMTKKMGDPKQGEIVKAWLQEFKRTINKTIDPVTTEPTDSDIAPAPAPTLSEEGTNLTVIIVPAVIAALVAIALIFWCCRRRARSRSEAEQSQPQPTANYQRPMSTPFQTDTLSLGTSSTNKDLHQSVGAGTRSTASSGSRPSGYSADENVRTAYQTFVETLLDDPKMSEKQIPYGEIEFASQVSMGAYGEIWVGYWNREIIAIKRLLRTKYQTRHDVESFAQEIQLSARLHHPNIVRFIGVAWDRPEDLCMVLEFLPAGDLSKVLRESGEQLTWNHHKLSMARGLASAISYLHSQSPAIIHRDLKSKNVLLTNTLEPKIIDFGVSRRKMDDTMTAGVGTPYWTAPEVLEGLRYTEKSDIYSFGVLLTELDTLQIPYHDVSNDSGGMVHLKILNQVVAGKLRPSVSESCPDVIREVIVCCLRQDPTTRPTAAEVLWMLA